MTLQVNYELGEYSDNTLRLELSTPTAIGGMNLSFEVTKRFGSTDPFIVKSMASGRYGVSGMNIVNSGTGVMTLNLYDAEFSGHPYGNYAARWRRLDSGYLKVISEGFICRTP